MNKLFLTAAMMFTIGTAQAVPSLSFILGADDYAEIFISTADTQQGSLIGSTSFFSGPLQIITGNLTTGVTNYIHILVQNYGGPFTIAGEFTLSDQSFAFANNAQFLSTQTSNVNLSTTGFGENYETPLLWGGMTDYDSYYSDQYTQPSITQNIGGNDTPVAYFSIPVYAVTSVAEPESVAMLLVGFSLIGLLRRKSAYNNQS